MSKVRNLPELLSISDADLIYAVESAVNPNGGRRATIATLRSAILLASAVKTVYESNADTNAFTDAEKAKLATVETGAEFQNASEVPYNNSVSGLAASEVQTAIDLVNTAAQADFRPSIVSGRILHYTGGTARFDDIFFLVLTGDILLDPNITLGEVYVDLDGLVKQTGSGVNAPPLSIVFAKFSTDLNNIISLTDQRVKSSQNIVRGIVADVRDVRAGAAASEGTSGRISDAMHKHNILTAVASAISLNVAASEGSSISLARADHGHLLETDTAVDISNANGAGSGNKVAASNHTHRGLRSAKANSGTERFQNISFRDGTGTAVTDDGSGNFTIDTTIGPNELKVTQGAGLTVNYTAGRVRINGITYNISASSFSVVTNATNGRIYVDVDGIVKSTTSTSSPPNAISLAIFSSNVSAITALDDNRSLLNNNLIFGLSGDIGALAANGAAAAGTTNKYADAGHKHTAPTGTAVSISTSTSNSAGASGNFADASHTHAVSVSNSVASATVDDTTTSVTDVLIAGMTLTPVAGTYLAVFSSSMVNSGNGASRLFVSIYSAGAQVTHSERNIGISGGGNVTVHTDAIVTVNGSQAIEAQWRAVAGTNTAHQRSLILIKLD